MVNGEVQLQVLVDGKKVIITESTIRRDLQLEDAEGTDCLPNATIFEQLTLIGYEKLSQKLTFYKAFFSRQWKFLIYTILQCLSAKTTAWNEFRSTMASAIICLATNQKFNFSKYIFDSMVKNLDNVNKFWMYPRFVQVFVNQQVRRVTPLFPTMMVQAQEEMGKGSVNPTDPHHIPIITQPLTSQSQKKQKSRKLKRKDTERVINLEDTKTTQALEITSLKLRVKKLEKKGGSRTHKLKRLYKIGRSARVISSDEASLGDQEDASKQGRKIDDIDKDAEVTLVDETQGRFNDEEMFDTGILNDEEVFVKLDVVEKEVSTADPVTTAGEVVTTASVEVSTARPTEATIADELTLAQTLIQTKSAKPKVKGVLIKEQSDSTTRTRPQQLPSKDKGKGIMEEPEKPIKKKDQMRLDEELAYRLQAKEEEEVRLAREKAEKEQEANVALIEEWNDIQAKIEADQLLAESLQAREQEDLTIEERAKLFQQLLEKRRKFFVAKSVEEKRNKPPTKAQQRSIMTTYLKNLAGWKPKDLKNKSFTNETAELQSMMEVIPDEEEVAVDAIPLATKPPSIIDWKIIKEGKIGYYQIIRADRNSKRYSSMIQMLKSFDREDLETLMKLVKAKHGYTRPEEGYERVLWGDLKIMFGHNIEDTLWRNLLGNKVLIWKLFDSCGVHFVRFQDMHIFMLVEKRYPLTPAKITEMLNMKL
ncbi:hypothetical protein Tco_1028974 [Tanacetum coccineum]|uniref:Synaptobrevin, longin-like domain protein n=1 Tax=Tanacetum coccineum TaxID=301880 RepID=A0ABQ5G243_9ASTR